MSSLGEVVDLNELAREIEVGNIRRRFHPTEPLAILNYTEQAQYTHAWSETVRRCRGLIYCTDTDEVVARPWAKFFNHSQAEAGELDTSAPVEVTDKMDGSLGILYPLPSKPHCYAVATRGSFESEQAVWASAFWEGMEGDRLDLLADYTYLFEIVYPENRIVLDYRGQEDLVLLGAVHTATGAPVGPLDYACDRWDGPRTEVFNHATLAEALAQPPRANAEGLVIRYKQTGRMVKVKQEDYVILHKLVTGLNARAVWERMGAGESPEQIASHIPDEFHPWLHDVAADLTAQRDRILTGARREHERILRDLGGIEVDRKSYAAVASRSEHRPWLFLLLDGRDPSERVWRTLKPVHDYGPRALPSEDAA